MEQVAFVGFKNYEFWMYGDGMKEHSRRRDQSKQTQIKVNVECI